MPDLTLNVRKHMTGIGLIPAPVQLLRRQPQLDNEVAGQVLRLDLAPLLPPQSEQRRLVTTHNNTGIGTADK